MPWRRRIGLVTLLMACMAMAGWVRSRSYGESVHFPGFPGTSECLVSVDSSILWVTCEPGFSEGLFLPKWEHHEFDPRSDFYHIFSVVNVKWKWRLLGFGAGRTPRLTDPHGREFSFWIIPYWIIVLPLAALSAVLLLMKPCQPTQKKISEPVANERT